MILFQHTNYLHKSLVHLNFNMFTAVMFFFLQDPKYVEGMMNVLAWFHATRKFFATETYHFSKLSHQTGCLFTLAARSI